MRLLRSLGIVLAGMLVAGFAAMPIAASAAGQKVTITFWDTNAGPDRTPIYTALIKRFEKENPDIKVDYVGIPEADYEQKIEAAIASGATPDVANPGQGELADFIGEEGVQPLDSYFKSWSGRSQMDASSIKGVRAEAPDGKLYGLPYSANVDILFYRKDWIAQHSLPSPSTSWSAFYKDAKSLTDPGSNVYGFGLRGGSGSVAQLEGWIYAESGLTSYFNSKNQSTLSNPRAIAVVRKVVAMYGKDTSKGDINQTYQPMVAEFEGGHAAMIQHNLGSYPQDVQAMGASEVGASILPKSDVTGKQVIVNSGDLVDMIFKNSKHKAAAWKFVTFLSSPYADSYWNQQVGQIPTNTVAAKSAWVAQNQPIQTVEKALKSPTTVVVNPPVYLPDYSPIQLQMEPVFQKVLLGQVSVPAFMDQWAGLMTKAQQQYEQSIKHKKG